MAAAFTYTNIDHLKYGDLLQYRWDRQCCADHASGRFISLLAIGHDAKRRILFADISLQVREDVSDAQKS
jgi:hypothetical protein